MDMKKNKGWNRKRPSHSFTLSGDNSLLIKTLSMNSGKTRSSILDIMIDYMIANHKDIILDIVNTG